MVQVNFYIQNELQSLEQAIRLLYPQWMVARGYKRFTKVDLAEVLGRKPEIRL